MFETVIAIFWISRFIKNRKVPVTQNLAMFDLRLFAYDKNCRDGFYCVLAGVFSAIFPSSLASIIGR